MTANHPPPIALGISSYAYPWAIGVPGHPPDALMTAFDLLDMAVQADATNLQLADNLPVHTLSDTRWQDLLTKANGQGIQLELGIRGLTVPQLRTYLKLSRQCSASFLRVVIDGPHYEPSHDEIVATIREVLPAFRKVGLVLAIENHDRFRATDLTAIIEATDPEWVAICLDTANSLGADEGIYEVATHLLPYTVNLHVKDYRIDRLDHGMGFTVTGAAAGTGQAPIPWLLTELTRFGKCRSATLETWSLPAATTRESIEREREWSATGAAYLQSALREVNLPTLPTNQPTQ